MAPAAQPIASSASSSLSSPSQGSIHGADAPSDLVSPSAGNTISSTSFNGGSPRNDDNPLALEAESIVSRADIQHYGEDAFFSVSNISDEVFARMDGVTFPANCPVTRDELRYIRVLHVDANGNCKVGELVANEAIAQELCDLFRDLYHANYAIERMRLADDYDGDDEQSMQANNTSCFNCRPIEGTGAQSQHSYGLAVDINPLYNPYVRASQGIVLPTTAAAYIDRSVTTPYTIDPADACCQAFALKGYLWGGDWTDPKDYQHFEKSGR